MAKAGAQTAGSKTAMRERVEHLVANCDGQVGERNSSGGDSARIKG